MVVAGMALAKILQNVKESKTHLTKSIGETVDATWELRQVAKLLGKDLDRVIDERHAIESSADRALGKVSSQLHDLGSLIREGLHGGRNTSATPQAAVDEGLTQRLRDKLKDVMTQNIQLKQEIGRARSQITTATESSDGIRDGLNDMKGGDPVVIKDLNQRVEQLNSDLAEARRRAQTAERLTEANALKLDEMREQMSAASYRDTTDDSKTVQDLRDQLEEMAAREKSFLARIELMESELQRQLTEKSFIEERFVELDSKAS